jgi:hypothetical protein
MFLQSHVPWVGMMEHPQHPKLRAWLEIIMQNVKWCHHVLTPPHITYFLFHTHHVPWYPLSDNNQGCTCPIITSPPLHHHINPAKGATSERWGGMNG